MNKLKYFDNSYLNRKVKRIAGVDEAGRGPLAGPVVAAAVIFDKKSFIEGVTDSKKLTERRRNELFGLIINQCLTYGIGIVDHIQIDKVNILQAALMAMKIAVDQLNPQPGLILIDGNKSFVSDIPTETVIKGDSISFSIAAASIIAKVTRDRIMKDASKKHPEFMWHKNKGYGTKAHIEAIKKYGTAPLHRTSFLSKITGSIQEEIFFNKRK